ncbi:hypothetical protein ACT426_16330 [Acinetobacter baumannii]
MGLKIRSKLKYTLLIIFIFLIWTYFPFIFSVLMSWMGWLGADLKGFSEFGAIGDIYGSLNTLISSLALCAVAYSTILQVNELKLARQTYVDQLNEAKYSNFSALFYSLLQNKQQTFNTLKVVSRNGETYIGQTLFAALSTDFAKFLESFRHSKKDELQSLTSAEVQRFFTFQMIDNYKGSVYSELLTYYASYTNILNLISKADIREDDKEFFIGILRDGMSIYEQMLLLAITSFDESLKSSIKNSRIIKSSFGGTIFMFIKKFHEQDLFADNDVIAKLSN